MTKLALIAPAPARPFQRPLAGATDQPPPADQATFGQDGAETRRLRDARATLAVHQPDRTGLCRGCMDLARLAASPCPVARLASKIVEAGGRSANDGSCP